MSTTTVTAKYLDPSGAACKGRVVFRLVAATYQDGLNAIFPTVPVTGVLDATGAISVELEPTSGVDADFDADDMTYQVTERINGTERDAYYVDIPTAASVDLGTLVTYDDPLPVTRQLVTVDYAALGYALAPVIGDGVQYVSTTGNDTQDGLSWGKAKLTVQAAITALANGGTVNIGEGTFAHTSALALTGELTLIGQGRNKTILTSTGANLINITANIECINFRSLCLKSTNAHVINVSTGKYVTLSSWWDVLFIAESDSKSVVNMPDGEWIDNTIEHSEIRHTITATVPTFNLISSNNAINTNTFRRIRCVYSGAYMFHIESTGGGYSCDNTFEDINFEVSNGGCVEILSCRNTLFKQCATYDLSAAMTNHQYHVGTSTAPGSPVSVETTFIHVTRRGGAVNGALKDVKIEASQGLTTMIGCDAGSGTGYTVDFGNTTGTWIGSTGATLQNAALVTRLTNYTSRTGQAATTDRPSAATQGAGSELYDTTLSVPVWSDGSSWLDATGNPTSGWTIYTPTLAGTGWALGNGTLGGGYAQVGKTVNARIGLVFGSSSTYGASASPTLTLPVTAAAGKQLLVTVNADDTGTASYRLHARMSGTGAIVLYVPGTNGLLAFLTATAPHAWAATDIIHVNMTYEAA